MWLTGSPLGNICFKSALPLDGYSKSLLNKDSVDEGDLWWLIVEFSGFEGGLEEVVFVPAKVDSTRVVASCVLQAVVGEGSDDGAIPVLVVVGEGFCAEVVSLAADWLVPVLGGQDEEVSDCFCWVCEDGV